MKRKWKSEALRWIGALIQEQKCDGTIYDVKTKWCWILQGRKLKQARWETNLLRFLALPNKRGEKVCLLLAVFMQKSHCPFFPHKNVRKTAEHCRDSRDAKNMNLDDSQPEGKVRNLALILLCENFPAVSTIRVRAGPQQLVQQVLKLCSVPHSTIRPPATRHVLGKAKLISKWWKN